MKMRRRCEGTTLTELMVTVGIIAVVSGLAYTGYHAFLKKTNLRESSYLLSQDLQSIRERAMSLGVPHIVFFDRNNDLYRAFRRDTVVLERHLRGEVSFSILEGVTEGACNSGEDPVYPVSFEGDTLIFYGSGDATPGSVYLSDGRSQMAIYVNPLGMVNLCSWYGGAWHD